jgi:hypothetical protein
VLALRAVAVVLTAWVLAILAPPGPASAGGPTSAMLSVPGEGRTASLYYSDDAYEKLARLVDVGGAGTVDESGRSHDTGTGVTVTWLVHDVEPWRVDRIYLAGDDGPWIATQETLTGTGSIWDAPVVWHQPAAGKELSMLLDSLGVGQAGAASGTGEPGSAVEPGPAVPASVEPASTAPAPAPTDEGSASANRDRLWWGLGGLAGGVLLAAGWTRVRSRRQAPDDWDPDAERLDTDPAKEWLTSAGR